MKATQLEGHADRRVDIGWRLDLVRHVIAGGSDQVGAVRAGVHHSLDRGFGELFARLVPLGEVLDQFDGGLDSRRGNLL